MTRVLGAILVAVALTTWTSASDGAEKPSDRVIANARALVLWEDPAWLALVHYRRDWFGGIESTVDGAAFFLSREGKSDPRAELEATLRAFYLPVTRRPDAHARCRFPARLHWLDERLRFARELPHMRCPGLERHRQDMTPDSVALVFAANSVENPVTAFGHTFLLFHRREPGRTKAVEYAADIDTKNPVLYPIKGLFGMFRGHYRLQAAEPKQRWYLDGDRDLWEYELALTRTEVEQLTRHLWELSATHFDYYYMAENCSYGVLALLDGAVHRLELLDRIRYLVLPVDTVRALSEAPGLIRTVRHRPARPTDPALAARSAPHRGHGSMRVSLGTGFTSQYDDGFATLGYRVALHDLTDPSVGQPAMSQIQFLDTRLRYEARQRRFTLNQLTFAELLALQPVGRGLKPSWRARAHGQRLHDAGCRNDDCFAHGLNGSLGLTLGTADERVTTFAMADAYMLLSGQLDGIGGSSFRGGVGPYAGIRVNAPDAWVGLVTGSWSYLPGQDVTSTYELRGTARASLARDVALAIEGLIHPRAIEAQLLSSLYF